MLAKINKGQLVLLNIKKSCSEIKKYFKESKINIKKGYGYFISLYSIMVKGEYDKKKYFIIKTIINSFKDLVSINRNNSNKDVNTNNNFNKKEYTSNDFDKKECTSKNFNKEKCTSNNNKLLIKNVLWVSRHNMLIDGYLDLQKLYPNYAICVFPCQPRVLEGKTVYEYAELYNCNIICAILSDNIFKDIITDLRANKYTILRPIITAKETDASVRKGLGVSKQRQYIFHNWRDMKNNIDIKF